MVKQSSSTQPATKGDLDREIKGLRAEVKRGDKALSIFHLVGDLAMIP